MDNHPLRGCGKDKLPLLGLSPHHINCSPSVRLAFPQAQNTLPKITSQNSNSIRFDNVTTRAIRVVREFEKLVVVVELGPSPDVKLENIQQRILCETLNYHEKLFSAKAKANVVFAHHQESLGFAKLLQDSVV